MIRLKYFEFAGETGFDFYESLSDPMPVRIRPVEVRLLAEIVDGPLKGNTEHIVWAGDFQAYPLSGVVSTWVSRVDGRSFYKLTFSDPVDLTTFTGLASLPLGRGVTVQGNSFANSIEGDRGGDSLFGNGGDDVLKGLAGNDTLDGGPGADFMLGGLGDDIYYQDDRGDVIAEKADRGIDLVMSSVGGSLSENVENLQLTSREDISARGNNLGNRMEGLAGDNVLNGFGGNDRIFGQGGRDLVIGGNGWDILGGGSGSDRLRGGMGRDVMHGDTGADRFEYFDAAESRVGQPDTIIDFEIGLDTIDLRHIDADSGRAGNQRFVFIGNDIFGRNGAELRIEGNLVMGDVDGDGSADFAIGIRADGILTEGDFIL